MESPTQPSIVRHPDPDVVLTCKRLYLAKAKEALAALGATYLPTKEELRVELFQERIPLISKVIFGSGGYFGDTYNHIARLDGDSMIYDFEYLREPTPGATPPKIGDRPKTVKDFLAVMSCLNIGEWLEHYSTERYGFTVCDGTSWWLEVEYNGDNEPFVSGGSNAYPYNFAQLERLFGIESAFCEDE